MKGKVCRLPRQRKDDAIKENRPRTFSEWHVGVAQSPSHVYDLALTVSEANKRAVREYQRLASNRHLPFMFV